VALFLCAPLCFRFGSQPGGLFNPEPQRLLFSALSLFSGSLALRFLFGVYTRGLYLDSAAFCRIRFRRRKPLNDCGCKGHCPGRDFACRLQ
jgi:hypothetical protein